jgi:hypothetical protein
VARKVSVHSHGRVAFADVRDDVAAHAVGGLAIAGKLTLALLRVIVHVFLFVSCATVKAVTAGAHLHFCCCKHTSHGTQHTIHLAVNEPARSQTAVKLASSHPPAHLLSGCSGSANTSSVK